MMTPQEIRKVLLHEGVKLRTKKDSYFMRFIGWLLAFTRINKRFMEDYITFMGSTIYFPVGYTPDPLNDNFLRNNATTFAHEFVHLRQKKKYKLLWYLSYLFFPLPFFLCWGRWRWEREAYLVNIKAGAPVFTVVNSLHAYGRPWPKPWMTKWFENNKGREPKD